MDDASDYRATFPLVGFKDLTLVDAEYAASKLTYHDPKAATAMIYLYGRCALREIRCGDCYFWTTKGAKDIVFLNPKSGEQEATRCLCTRTRHRLDCAHNKSFHPCS